MNRKQEEAADAAGRESARSGGGNDNPYHHGRLQEWFTYEDAKREELRALAPPEEPRPRWVEPEDEPEDDEEE